MKSPKTTIVVAPVLDQLRLRRLRNDVPYPRLARESERQPAQTLDHRMGALQQHADLEKLGAIWDPCRTKNSSFPSLLRCSGIF